VSDSTVDLDLAALGTWLDGQGLGATGAPIEVQELSGGIQNVIYEVRRDDLHAALRMPPPTAPEARDEGIKREWRIIEALEGTDVPHTPALGLCEDASVLGRPFYLMGFVDGWSPMANAGGDKPSWPEPFHHDLAARPGLAHQLIEGVALMGAVDWKAQGLEDLGRPDGYHERQVERWLRFFDRVKTREVPGIDEATAWLQSHKPIDFVPGLMHGDYQFANVMFEHGAPARLAAIVDWEMGTIGDPKLDLAWVTSRWPEDTSSEEAKRYYVDLEGMPGASELVEHYAKVSGRQVDDIDYYTVLARWKLAIVLEQSVKYGGDSPAVQALGPYVLDLMKRAADLAESTDYSG